MLKPSWVFVSVLERSKGVDRRPQKAGQPVAAVPMICHGLVFGMWSRKAGRPRLVAAKT